VPDLQGREHHPQHPERHYTKEGTDMIDMWSGPTPTPQQFKHNEPNGIRLLLDKIKALELQIKESTSNLLGTAGIRITREGMTINSDLTLAGTLTAAGFITSTELADGAVTAPKIGPGAVTAAALGAGSVGSVALAAPTLPAAVNAIATAFAVAATWGELVGVDMVVPTDCTRLLVTATCWCYGVNNSASADDLHTRVSLGATDGQEFLTPLAVAGYGTISAGLAVLAAGLTPGATLRIKGSAKTTTGAWTGDAANTANLVASLTWLR
jgi:hypothetical protein